MFCKRLPGIINSLMLFLLHLLLLWLKCNGEVVPKVDDIYYGGEVRKLGSPCSDEDDCKNIQNGFCEVVLQKCVCKDSHPVGKMEICYEAVALNHSCVNDEQCEYGAPNAHCSRSVCQCMEGHALRLTNNGTAYCSRKKIKIEPEVIVDYTMLGVLAGMAVMFVIMCIVLRMFSKARFQEPRSIFNSPRLLKMSLARKTREQNESRRGSRASVPSRQPSVYSGLNVPAKSPTGSHGSGDRRSMGSRRSSIQSPMNDRRSFPRNTDQVTVDIRGGKENPVAKTNQV